MELFPHNEEDSNEVHWTLNRQVSPHDFWGKFFRLSILVSKAFVAGGIARAAVGNRDLMKKGLRHYHDDRNGHILQGGKPRPDEKGIATLGASALSVISSFVGNRDLMKKGLRHYKVC